MTEMSPTMVDGKKESTISPSAEWRSSMSSSEWGIGASEDLGHYLASRDERIQI